MCAVCVSPRHGHPADKPPIDLPCAAWGCSSNLTSRFTGSVPDPLNGQSLESGGESPNSEFMQAKDRFLRSWIGPRADLTLFARALSERRGQSAGLVSVGIRCKERFWDDVRVVTS